MLCTPDACKNGPRETIAMEVKFFSYRRDHLLHIFFTPCHLTDAVSDKVVLVMKKQLFAKEMYLLQCHVIPSTRRGVFHAFMLLFQSKKSSFRT